MTIRPKTEEELAIMREGGKILSQVLKDAFYFIRAGQSLREIDKYINHQILQYDAKPAFLGFHGFPGSSCLSVNEAVVHGIPTHYKIKEGDILGVDVGVIWKGYNTDAAFTMPIGKVSREALNLLHVTQEALKMAIESAVSGNPVSAIGETVEKYVKSQGKFGIIRDLAGHGIGQKLQEAPQVLNVRNKEKTTLVSGMTLAIEPMISLGDHRVVVADDDWTVLTADDSWCAQFESTVAVNGNDPEILVDFPLVMPL